MIAYKQEQLPVTVKKIHFKIFTFLRSGVIYIPKIGPDKYILIYCNPIDQIEKI